MMPFDNPNTELAFYRALFKNLFEDENNYERLMNSLKSGVKEFEIVIIPRQEEEGSAEAAFSDSEALKPPVFEENDEPISYSHRMKLSTLYKDDDEK